jgi:hypothetical protein
MGKLQSTVQCAECGFKSIRTDPMAALALPCSPSLALALESFTRAEWLDGANKYFCSSCNAAVRASKQLLLKECPNLLTLQIQRFDAADFFGGKISAPIEFPNFLDATPFVAPVPPMPESNPPPATYLLTGVVSHFGQTASSGHYVAYAFCPRRRGWFHFDDKAVREVGEEVVLKQRAYLLFYSRADVALGFEAPERTFLPAREKRAEVGGEGNTVLANNALARVEKRNLSLLCDERRGGAEARKTVAGDAKRRKEKEGGPMGSIVKYFKAVGRCEAEESPSSVFRLTVIDFDLCDSEDFR